MTVNSHPTPTDPLISMLPLLLVFVVFYFFLIRPQSKRQKEHREMVAKIAVGDEVVTAGGVLGKVSDVGEQFVEVEVADGVKIKVQPTYARVTVDGVVFTGADIEVKLAKDAKQHVLKVDAPGYKPHTASFTAEESASFTIALERIPPKH